MDNVAVPFKSPPIRGEGIDPVKVGRKEPELRVHLNDRTQDVHVYRVLGQTPKCVCAWLVN